MFDFSSVIEFAKAEPGHGLLQSFLLLMIWWQSRGMRKDMREKFENHEDRIVVLEFKAGVEKMKK